MDFLQAGVPIREFASQSPFILSKSRQLKHALAECVQVANDVFTPPTNTTSPPLFTLPRATSIIRQIVERHGSEVFRLARDENEADALWGNKGMKNTHCTICRTHIAHQNGEETSSKGFRTAQMRTLEETALEERDILGLDRETFMFYVSLHPVEPGLKAQIEVLNSNYNAADIRCMLVKTTRIKSKDWFENIYPRPPEHAI
ncbi:hypothetical protein D9613_006384 [Agrocybe pediades]|uniref:Uncharacterized protein n=1 Tax=Agrocybe pediades TaxID=84607 RepID=A0A8H4VR80_9AGAR|nr:hypothetical protein D9613_006384 [Agrocybe pediades]